MRKEAERTRLCLAITNRMSTEGIKAEDWSIQKGFRKNTQFESFRPKFKKTQKKVFFLTKKEIKKQENYKIPDTKLYL